MHPLDVVAQLVAYQPGLHKDRVPGLEGAVREEETNSERQLDSGSAGKEYRRISVIKLTGKIAITVTQYLEKERMRIAALASETLYRRFSKSKH